MAQDDLFAGLPTTRPGTTGPKPLVVSQASSVRDAADDDLFAGLLTKPVGPKTAAPGFWDWLLTTGIRTVPAIAGGVVGGLLGGPGGAAVGGGAGGTLGEWMGQGLEVSQGVRERINPFTVAVSGGVSAIPGFGNARSVLGGIVRRGAEGALLSGGQYGLTELGEGRTPTVGGALTAGGFGAAFGGPLGGVEGGAAARNLAAKAVPAAAAAALPVPPGAAAAAAPMRRGIRIVVPADARPAPAAAPTPAPVAPKPVKVSPSVDPRAQGMAAIDAEIQPQLFELTLKRAEAQRAGDLTAVTEAENAILDLKMQAAEQKRNWQAPATPAPPAPPPPVAAAAAPPPMRRGVRIELIKPPDEPVVRPPSAEAQAAAQPAAATTGVPMMITNPMKTRLKALGYSELDINAMTPEQAHARLSVGAESAPSLFDQPAAAPEPSVAPEPPVAPETPTSPVPLKMTDSLFRLAREETVASPHGHVLAQDAQGVVVGRPRYLDAAINRGEKTLEDVASGFEKTRAALREQYGDTVILYRHEAPETPKHADTRTLLMGSQKLAEKFGPAAPYEVPINDVVAVYAAPNGYYEFVVRKPEGGLKSSTYAAPPPPPRGMQRGMKTAPLPKHLRGAKPRYQDKELSFESDLDRAAYIIAQDKPSNRDAEYLAYVMEHTGFDEATARAYGRETRSMIAGLREMPSEVGTIIVPARHPGTAERFQKKAAPPVTPVVEAPTPAAETPPSVVPAATPITPESGVAEVPPESLKVDPVRFQFKANVDPEGVTPTARIGGPWNENLGGVLLVWKDPKTGESFVVNGHHRLEAAKRLGAEKVLVRYLDVDSPTRARLEGALTNIAEGNGTAVDAAKVIRATSPEMLTNAGISSTRKLAREGLGLANLSDPLFERVATGSLDEGVGVAIGAANLTPENQAAVVQLIERQAAKGRELTPGQVRALIADVQTAPMVEKADEQQNMFSALLGEDRAQSVAVEKAVLRDWLTTTLAKDKRLFAFVSKAERAERLGAAGNVIKREASRAQSEEAGRMAAVVERLSQYKGPINDALTDAATRVASGESLATVRPDLLTAVRAAVESELAGRPPGSDRGGPAGGGAGSAGAHPGGDRPPGAGDVTPPPPPPDDDIQHLFGGLGVVAPDEAAAAFRRGWRRMQGLPAEGGGGLGEGIYPKLKPLKMPPGGPSGPSGVYGPEAPTSAMRTRIGRVTGDPVPPQQPLSRARIDGEQRYIQHLPEPFRDGVSEIIERLRHFSAQRRGVQPVDRSNALAAYEIVEKNKLLPKGSTMNVEQMTAARGALNESMNRVTELSEAIIRGDATDVMKLQQVQAVLESIVLTANTLGARAEGGRMLGSLARVSKALKTQDMTAIEQMIKAATRAGLDPRNLAADWAGLGNDPIKKMNFIRGLTKAGPMDWIKGYFFSNILSGPRTHLRNLLGNTSNAVFRMASQPMSVAWDVGRSAVTGKERTIYAGEAYERMKGTMIGLLEGLEDGRFALQHGFTRSDLGTFDVARKELQGGGANPLNWTGRLLEAEDQVFYAINYKAELRARLYTYARQQKIPKDLRNAQMAEWTLAPPKEIHAAANQAALSAVYKEKGGKLVEGLTHLKAQNPLIDFILPFVRTPGNLLRQGIEATPAAFLTAQTRAALKAGGRQQAEAIGRMVTGTAALGTLAWWAGAGNISGTGPKDPEDRAALMRNGWKPNAIKIGNAWVPFADIAQPLSQPLFAIANAMDLFKKDKTVDPKQVLLSAGSSLMDQSFVAGISDLNRALSDHERFGDQFIERWTQSWSPFSGLQRNVAQAIDPIVREPEGIVQGWQSIAPGLSSGVTPKIGTLGESIERQGNAFMRGVSPVSPGYESEDPVVQGLARLKINNLAVPSKKLQATSQFPAIELTVAERQAIGQATKAALADLFADPGFNAMDPEEAKELLQQAVQQARAAATLEIRTARESVGRR